MPLWEQVKGNLVEWYNVASDKTEELAKIGVRRYDKFGISRDIERQFTELGSFVFEALSEGRAEFASDATLLAIVERIKVLQQDLQHKETEIEEIRAVHRQKAATKAESAASATAATEAAVVDAEAAATVPVDESEPPGAGFDSEHTKAEAESAAADSIPTGEAEQAEESTRP